MFVISLQGPSSVLLGRGAHILESVPKRRQGPDLVKEKVPKQGGWRFQWEWLPLPFKTGGENILLQITMDTSAGISTQWFQETLYGRARAGSTGVDEDNNDKPDKPVTDEYAKAMHQLRLDIEQGDEPDESSPYYSDTSMLRIPLLGRIHYVYNLQGFMQIGFIFFYWIYGTFTTMFVVLIPMYNDGVVPLWVVLCKFVVLSHACFTKGVSYAASLLPTQKKK